MDLFLFLARGPAVYVRTYSSLSGEGGNGFCIQIALSYEKWVCWPEGCYDRGISYFLTGY